MTDDRGQYIGLHRSPARPDLELMLRRRQDELRGRKENWRDRLSDWWRDYDFEGILIDGLIFTLTFGGIFLLGVLVGAALGAVPSKI